MAERDVIRPRNLPRKPLAEAIFELRWTLQTGESGLPHDPAFRILLGRFYDQVKSDAPCVVDLPASQVPEEIVAYSVRHQFRPARDVWPVLQVGPGILTVNETSGYSWEGFRSHAKRAIQALFAAYPSDLAQAPPLKVHEARLRYINVVKYDPEETALLPCSLASTRSARRLILCFLGCIPPAIAWRHSPLSCGEARSTPGQGRVSRTARARLPRPFATSV